MKPTMKQPKYKSVYKDKQNEILQTFCPVAFHNLAEERLFIKFP